MIQIAYQNQHFIAVDKPLNWLSVPSRMGERDARNTLGTFLQNEVLKKQIYPVHRLDFEVSGVILFALSKEAHKDSQLWFEDKSMIKIYEASTENPHKIQLHPEQQFLWKSTILRGKKRAYEHETGKLAITKAIVLTTMPLKWELQPVTGRSHQLRFELSKQGYPICGDTLYGAKPLDTPGISLRAVRLTFPLEIQKKWSLPQKIEVPSHF